MTVSATEPERTKYKVLLSFRDGKRQSIDVKASTFDLALRFALQTLFPSVLGELVDASVVRQSIGD